MLVVSGMRLMDYILSRREFDIVDDLKLIKVENLIKRHLLDELH